MVGINPTTNISLGTIEDILESNIEKYGEASFHKDSPESLLDSIFSLDIKAIRCEGNSEQGLEDRFNTKVADFAESNSEAEMLKKMLAEEQERNRKLQEANLDLKRQRQEIENQARLDIELHQQRIAEEIREKQLRDEEEHRILEEQRIKAEARAKAEAEAEANRIKAKAEAEAKAEIERKLAEEHQRKLEKLKQLEAEQAEKERRLREKEERLEQEANKQQQMAEMLRRKTIEQEKIEKAKQERIAKIRELQRRMKLSQTNNETNKSPTINYGSLDIDSLFKEVKNYIISSSSVAVVSREMLNNKFGADNINKLVVKSYLVCTRKGVTFG